MIETKRQLFGTDGIRGVAGAYPLDEATVFAIGAALGQWAKRTANGGHAEIVIGMDTRESGPWIAAMVAGGAARFGVSTRFAGLVTTPGVAYLTRTRDFVAGVMISASHNPFQDNGIKVFGHDGYKLPDAKEAEIEGAIFTALAEGVTPEPQDLIVDEGLDAAYVDFLAASFSGSLKGKKLVLDCANGAASHLAPELFERLGAEVIALSTEPNGRNINLGCGALHPERLAEEVVRHNADAGVAFDGDADRAMLISASGRLIDGDNMLLICARALKAAGKLPGDIVVATVMSNMGLEVALSAEDIRLVRTAVGDKYVLEEMIRSGGAIGGEQSGHIIFHQYATTGDGMLTAVRIFEVMAATGKSLDELAGGLEIYPQRLVNVRVREKTPMDQLPPVMAAIRECESYFHGKGRVLVRYSGTESLARVMVEGPEIEHVERFAESVAGVLRQELGA